MELQQLSNQVQAIINSNEVKISEIQKTPEFINAVKERYIEYFGVSRFTNVFLMAAFAAIVFRSSRRVYGEHTVFVLHYVAFDFAFNTIYLLSIFSLRDTFGLVLSPVVLYMPLLFTFAYIIVSAKKVYGGSLISNFIRCFILFFCDIILTMTTSGLTLTVAYYFSVMKLS